MRLLLKLKSGVDVKRVAMVYVREHSRTRGMLSQFMCLDVVILIEDYLIPRMPKSGDARAIRRAKLECGFAEYIEMEFGPRDVIEKMFLDACEGLHGNCDVDDIFSLLAAGARNLKSGLTTAIMSNRTTYIPSILISLDAIGTANEYQNRNRGRRGVFEFDVIKYIVNRPAIGYLLSMVGPIKHPNHIQKALYICVESDSIEMIEALISRVDIDIRQLSLTDVLMFAIDHNSQHIMEYAINAGANVQIAYDNAIRDNPNIEIKLAFESMVIDWSTKRRRTTSPSSDSSP